MTYFSIYPKKYEAGFIAAGAFLFRQLWRKTVDHSHREINQSKIKLALTIYKILKRKSKESILCPK
jgi:hypothetical protein